MTRSAVVEVRDEVLIQGEDEFQERKLQQKRLFSERRREKEDGCSVCVEEGEVYAYLDFALLGTPPLRRVERGFFRECFVEAEDIWPRVGQNARLQLTGRSPSAHEQIHTHRERERAIRA